MARKFCVAALDFASDRSGFRSGVEPLDRYFRAQVSQDIKRRVTACFVATNAHAVKVKGKKYSGRCLPFDHKHRHVADKGVPYEFKDAHQLLSDFFTEVDSVLREVKSR